MAKRYVPRTYKNFRVVRVIVKLILSFALVFAILFVALFFGLKKYIVHPENPDDGLRLVIPFLMEEESAPPE